MLHKSARQRPKEEASEDTDLAGALSNSISEPIILSPSSKSEDTSTHDEEEKTEPAETPVQSLTQSSG